MNHRQARRLLPAVLDHTLPAPGEAAVRRHAEGCPVCAAELEELEAAETLLRRLPASLVPREASPCAEARLLGLARWARLARPVWPERLGLSAAGAFTVAAMLALVVGLGSWEDVAREPQTYQSFAALVPDGDSGFGGWR